VEPFAIPVRVYWEDTDAGGVVYYASYLRFLERARSDWLRAQGIDQVALLRDERLQFVVVEAKVRYHRPARLNDDLRVSVRIGERRGASMVFEQEIRRGANGSELLVSASVRAACLTSDAMRPKPLPTALMERIQKESP
jgi:acyl-CoA thioester hydrolase